MPVDPACDALLSSMGVRERQRLAAVPYALIASWQTALAHPGMAVQFASPIGFAVAQMQRGNSPPPITELDRWEDGARRKGDRYEAQAALAEIQQQVERLRVPLCFEPIHLAVAAADAPAQGMTLADFAPSTPIARAYRRVTEQILTFLEDLP